MIKLRRKKKKEKRKEKENDNAKPPPLAKQEYIYVRNFVPVRFYFAFPSRVFNPPLPFLMPIDRRKYWKFEEKSL